MRAGSVHHLAVLVDSVERVAPFYVDVLGLPVVRRHLRDDGTLRSVWLALDDARFLAIEETPTGPAAVPQDDVSTPRAGLHCLALAIDARDRDAWRERLERHGVAIERESDFTLYVRDPVGALIALSHYPEPRG
ncbi:MAG: VOC family protein [Sandaracinaceae bacterium]